MKSRAPLKLVPAETKVVDIYAAWKAEIASRDWRAVHVRGDRREAVELPETRKRSWLA
jgi:hypothetical protein